MKTLRIAALFFLLLSNVYGQTGRSPYPIIFVHGLVGSDETFKETMDSLNGSGISWGPINVFDVVLNADNDLKQSTLEQDVKWEDFYFGGLINVGPRNFAQEPKDFIDGWQPSSIFAINFKEERIRGAYGINDLFDHSNQSAIFKQAKALREMIDYVLTYTKAKKVILVGHSMGGLAIREYLQRTIDGKPNSAHRCWYDPSDSQFGHRVAKVVTIGTPHLGSNSFTDPTSSLLKGGPDTPQSKIPSDNGEALRDLKYSYDSYPGCNLLNPVGIYLFGGKEECLIKDITDGNSPFENVDINCNGVKNDFIVGINAYNQTTFNPNMPLPPNIEYTWITSNAWMGEASGSLSSCVPNNVPGDGAVLLSKQWLYDNNLKPMPIGIADTLLTNKPHADIFFSCNSTTEAEDYITIIRGLDEPDSYQRAYEYELTSGKSIKGFITFQSHGLPFDTDFFKVVTQQTGELLIEIKGTNSGVGQVAIFDANLNPPISTILNPGTYYIRVTGTATSETWKNPYSLTVTLKPNGTNNPPTVTTIAATNVTQNLAQLNGSVNPNGASTTYYFEYGTTTSYGSKTNSVNAGSGVSVMSVNSPITSLSPNTTYHFRLVATNSGGTNYGNDLTFTASPQQGAPTVTTTAGTNVTHNSAQLNGSVNPNGASTTYYFEYGTTTSYGSTTSIGNAGSGTSAIFVNSPITGLSSSSTYHFRLVATNSSGTNRGNDLTLTTPPTQGLPYVEAGDPANVTCSSAQLNGTVNPNGLLTTAWIVCSQSPDLVNPIITQPQTIGSGTSAVSFSQTVTGLSSSTEYFCRIKANNSAGMWSGSQINFTTTACGAPTVETKPATGITSWSVQLNGTIKSNSGGTWYYFEWGTSTDYGSKSPESGPNEWMDVYPINKQVFNLNANTTYHFRFVARNSAGTSYGNDLPFTTLATPPAVTTTTAMNVTHDSAQLNGSVNPNGGSTTYYFEYGTTASYGSKTSNANAGSGTSAVFVNSPITGLSSNTTYHFRLVATNSGGANNGKDLTFTTLAIPLPAPAAYGKIPGGDQTHPDKVVYSFTGIAGDIYLSFQVYDIAANEVNAFLNDIKVRNIASTSENQWSGNRGVLLPDAMVNDGQNNIVVFDNTQNPPQAPNWGIRQVSVDRCLPLPAIEAYGKIHGGDQTHVDKVVYCIPGRAGDVIVNYEVYDIDYDYELDINLNGGKERDEAITGDMKWSSKRTLLLKDAKVNNTGINLLIFANTKNPPNSWFWGVRNVSIAPPSAFAAAGDSSQSLARAAIDEAALPSSFQLAQNFPNPFNPSTTIRFALPVAGNVKLTVYNLNGELVRALVAQAMPAGTYNVKFDASGLASGTYLYRLDAGAFTAARRMILTK